MERFCSALVINSRLFPGVHQVFKPRYNKEYFKRLTANIDSLEKQIGIRAKNLSSPSLLLLDNSALLELKENSKKLVQLKNCIDKIRDDEVQLQDSLAKLEAIENLVLPSVVAIPNRYNKTVPEVDTILGQVKSDSSREGVTKMLSHTKLSYINNCYSKSVVGPNSSYYFGIAAKLHHGIRDYFMQNLEQNKFIPLSGLCMTKSAVVEAVNSEDNKDYFTDPCRILTEDSKFTTTHLVEASRESLVGFVATLGHRSSNKPLRLQAYGSGYCIGSDWFDSDDKRASQFETVHTLVHTASIEQYSLREYETVRDIIWNLYTGLGLPVRLNHCCLSSMRLNEYDTHRIDIWLPSRSQWIEIARISHYIDYITVRTGMKRGHMIDSMVYDSRALIAAIIENNQTSRGKFLIPTVIEEFMPYMNESEQVDYLRSCREPATTASAPLPLSSSSSTQNQRVASSCNGSAEDSPPPMFNAFSNYQQRRYLVKKTYLFDHSHRAAKNNTYRRVRARLIAGTFCLMVFWSLDWDSIWYDYLPMSWKRFVYDYIYRPMRRVYWSTIYVRSKEPPADLTFDEIDKTEYLKDIATRRKEGYQKFQPKGRLTPIRKYPNDSGGEKVADNIAVVDQSVLAAAAVATTAGATAVPAETVIVDNHNSKVNE